jgi:hypothetical protein
MITRLLRATGGSIAVEYTIMYPVLFAIFMTTVQLGMMEVGSLTTSHAAVEAARAASVILPDDPRHYGGASVGVAAGRRLADITEAARAPLTVVAAKPAVTVSFPDRTSFVPGDQVRVRIVHDFPCRVAIGSFIVCGPKGTMRLTREATMPYQGAGYTYR